MRPGWKRVAEYADTPAFTTDEIDNAIILAVEQDWRGEVPREFWDALFTLFRDQEGSLFKDQLGPQLHPLRGLAGSGIGRVVLDEAIQVSESGVTGISALNEATKNALIDRAARCARQVEEHYFRESTAPRAYNVRVRIEEAIGIANMDGLARQILKLDNGVSALPPLKQQGLDDGVRF
jgi:hypothetical protein